MDIVERFLGRNFGQTISCSKCSDNNRCPEHLDNAHISIGRKYLCFEFITHGSCSCITKHSDDDFKILYNKPRNICVYAAYNNIRNNPNLCGCTRDCKYSHTIEEYMSRYRKNYPIKLDSYETLSKKRKVPERQLPIQLLSPDQILQYVVNPENVEQLMYHQMMFMKLLTQP